MQKKTQSKIDNFALPGDKSFIRVLVVRIMKQKELVFGSMDGDKSRGFVTGLDENWLTLTTTQDQRMKVLNINNLCSMEETGFSLQNVPIEIDDSLIEIATDADVSADELVKLVNERRDILINDCREKIKFYCSTLHAKARDAIKEQRELSAQDRIVSHVS
jgi:hypothetical protein